MTDEEKELYMKYCKYDKEPKEVIIDLISLIENQQKEIENAYWKGYTARDTEAQSICKSCKYRKT